jgi:hypothetical protein
LLDKADTPALPLSQEQAQEDVLARFEIAQQVGLGEPSPAGDVAEGDLPDGPLTGQLPDAGTLGLWLRIPGLASEQGTFGGLGPAGAAAVLTDDTAAEPAPALAGLVRAFGALFRDSGDEFAGLEAAFAGHGGQFVTQ